MASKTQTVIQILKKDHMDVKELFDKFENSSSAATKDGIIEKAIAALEVHATLEEKLVYPGFRPHIEEELADESLEEHHVVHMLIRELKSGKGEPGRRHAKFMVLAENVRHHIKEEEGELFPQVKTAEIDWESLAESVEKMRAKLDHEPARA